MRPVRSSIFPSSTDSLKISARGTFCSKAENFSESAPKKETTPMIFSKPSSSHNTYSDFFGCAGLLYIALRRFFLSLTQFGGLLKIQTQNSSKPLKIVADQLCEVVKPFLPVLPSFHLSGHTPWLLDRSVLRKVQKHPVKCECVLGHSRLAIDTQQCPNARGMGYSPTFLPWT